MIDYNSLLLEVPMGETIPKSLNQVFIGQPFEQLDPKIKENIDYIQKLNSNWAYQLYDEAKIETFISEYYGETILRYYKKISPKYRAAQADFFRYLLMYRFGGVYMDIKASMNQALDDVLLPDDKYILYHWDNAPGQRYQWFGYSKHLDINEFPYGEFPQGYIITVAGHPILRETILEVMRRIDSYDPFTVGVGLVGVLLTTGPLAYSKVVHHMIQQLPTSSYRAIRCCEVLGLRVSIFDEDGAFAHRKKYSTYNNNLSAVINNGSQYFTTLLYPYFYGRWIIKILRDKLKHRFSKD